MYVIKILNDKEYDQLPYRFARQSVGCADQKKGTAYIRSSRSRLFDLFTIGHEIDELISRYSPHEVDGIRYKGKSEPQIVVPPAPKLPTAEELFQTATKYGQENWPLAYGAREAGLADLAKGLDYYSQFGYKTPTTITPEYYQQWQPTSFEQALATQGFENIWPDLEAQIKHNLSLSGMAYSPQLAATLAKEKGILSTDIGEILANLGQTRATQALTQEQNINQLAAQLGQYSLGSRMGIAPEAAYGPYLETDINQANLQAQLNYQQALMQAQADYQNALNEAKQKSAKGGAIGAGIGTAAALALAIPTGGASLAFLPTAASLGGTLGSSFSGSGGAGSPISFQDALALSQIFNKQAGTTTPYTGLGSSGGYFKQFQNIGTAQPVNDFQKILQGYSKGWSGDWNISPYAIS